MVVFLIWLLLISAVAFGVIAAFALPHLRAGSPVLTERGERVARRLSERLHPVGRALRWVAPVVRPVARLAGTAARPVVRVARPRLAPVAEAISRAVEEGSAPSPVVRRGPEPAPRTAPDQPASAAAEPSPAPDGVEVLRMPAQVRAPAPLPAVASPLARR